MNQIADDATSCGASVHWRSTESASDTATSLSVVQDFLHFHADIRAIAVVQCTSPFLCPDDLIAAMKIFQNSSIDCVFSATRSFKLRWKIGSHGFAQPENFNPDKRPRRQDWPGELQETGMFYFSTRHIIQNGLLQNNKCQIVEVPSNRSIEIDTALDLDIARMISKIVGKC